MISIPLPLQAPFFVILLGIILCLTFEAAGVPEGYRRLGNKNYLSLIAIIVVICVFLFTLGAQRTAQIMGGFRFDVISRSAILSLCTLLFTTLWLIADTLKPLYGDRGEIYALILVSFFICVVICSSEDLVLMSTAVVALPFTQLGILSLGKKHGPGPEVALKLIMFSGFMLLLLAGVYISFTMSPSPSETITQFHFGFALIFSLGLIFLGAVPVQSMRVDVLDGSPSYASAFVGASALIVATVVILRLINRAEIPENLTDSVYWLFFVFAAATLWAGPIMALDQSRLSRLLAYLMTSQSGLVLLIATLVIHQSKIPEYFHGFLFTHYALCAVGSYAGIDYWKRASGSFRTWEDFSGAGREHAVAAGSFFVILASMAGIPFTSGFVVRNEIISLTHPMFRLPVIIVIFISIILSSVPIFRLFAFLFGKEKRTGEDVTTHPRQSILLFLCALLLFSMSIAPKAILTNIFR